MKNRVFRRLLSKAAARPFDLGAWYGNLAAVTHFDNQLAFVDGRQIPHDGGSGALYLEAQPVAYFLSPSRDDR